MKGKNKLAPRLLGITKKSIVRVDENSKEVSALRDVGFCALQGWQILKNPLGFIGQSHLKAHRLTHPKCIPILVSVALIMKCFIMLKFLQLPNPLICKFVDN